MLYVSHDGVVMVENTGKTKSKQEGSAMNFNDRNKDNSYPVESRKPYQLSNEIQAGYQHWSGHADYSRPYPGDSTKSLSDYVDMFYKRKKLLLTVFFFVIFRDCSCPLFHP